MIVNKVNGKMETDLSDRKLWNGFKFPKTTLSVWSRFEWHVYILLYPVFCYCKITEREADIYEEIQQKKFLGHLALKFLGIETL